MPGIPDLLFVRVRDALLDSGACANEGALRAVFTHEWLQPWQNDVPQANSPGERAKQVISVFHAVTHQSRMESVLVLLLRVLAMGFNEADARKARLSTLADELAAAASPGAPGLARGTAHSSGALKTLFQSLIEEKTANFVGREYIVREIEDALASETKGVVTIAGDPGAGKSALMASFIERTGCIGYFNIRSQGVIHAVRFLEFVCSELIDRYHLPDASLPADAVRDGPYLARLLTEASGRLAEGQRLIVAIDALDEVDLTGHPRGVNILYLPDSPPEKVFFVVTRRRVGLPWLISGPERLIDLGRDKYWNETRHDVRTYIRNAAMRPQLKGWIEEKKIGFNYFVDVLVDKSENNFMYLKYVLPELALGKYGDLRIDALPSGLESYYEYHWKYMGMMDKPLPRTKIKIVYVLSEARRPVSLELIADFTSEDALTVQEVLDEWDQYLHKDQTDGETRYSVYHTSFRDFLHRKDIVKAAGVTIAGINKLIADNLWGDLFR